MAYTKYTWNTGEVITSEKLNHMEDGIASGGVMIIGFKDADQTTFDKTWQEIYDAVNRGAFCIIRGAATTGFTFDYITEVGSGDSYYVNVVSGSSFVSATNDGYPTLDTD